MDLHIYTRELLDKHLLPEIKEIAQGLGISPEGNKTRRETWVAALVGQPFPVFQSIENRHQEPIENSLGVDRVQEPIEQAVETSPGVGVEQVQEAIVPAAENSPGVEVDPVSEPIIETTKTPSGVEVDPVSELIAQAVENSPGVETEATVSESAIGLPAKNPILTGIVLSDRFCARYSPPQAEIIHFQSDADGQLSLLNFEIESVSEPPDPDDFETLDAFREAIARWDWEHPSSFDHCSDRLPSSVHSEPNSVHCEPNFVHCEPNSVHSEPLEVSLDSFCEWAPCPEDWYESHTLLESSKVLEVSELSPARKSSITSDFFIPTFGRLGARSDRSDEPPDTGTFAKLPKPKPPSFPPTATQTHTKRIPNAGQVRVKLSPNSPYLRQLRSNFKTLAYCGSIAVGRSPPGGDAM